MLSPVAELKASRAQGLRNLWLLRPEHRINSCGTGLSSTGVALPAVCGIFPDQIWNRLSPASAGRVFTNEPQEAPKIEKKIKLKKAIRIVVDFKFFVFR